MRQREAQGRLRAVPLLLAYLRTANALRDYYAGEAAEFCVGGDELGLVGAGGGVEEGVGHGEAVVEAGIGGGECGHFVEGDDAAVESLREKAIGERFAAMAGKLAIDLVDDERRDDDRGLVLKVVAESGSFGILGEVFEPAGGIDEIELRGPSGHDNPLSISCLWRRRGV